MSDAERTRLDRWLWYARFFKTRTLARQAVEGGRVHLGGARVKPGRRFEVTVLALGERRGPAPEAQGLYSESEASIARRAEAAAQRHAVRTGEPGGGRPGKRDRRRLRAFREGLE
jgi:ribosome-associated heat shock protein Hsp15